MSRKLFTYFLSLILFPLTFETCTPNKDHCILCNPLTNLCIKCDKNIYKPDENGGCEFSKTCKIGQNYCHTCNSNENFCSSCDLGYYADESGGCATTENCIISYKGECLQCTEDYYLLGNDKFKYCKYKYSEELQNCEDINFENGLCENCTYGYFKNSGDNKCIETKNCTESLYGVCTKCEEGFYLDKRDDECKNWDKIQYCKISIDGEFCDECVENYYITENGKCVKTKYCEKSDENLVCRKCVDNYYLSLNDDSCTNEKNCKDGYKDLGLCKNCDYLFYLNVDDGKCISNQENNNFKFCRKVEKNTCIECSYDYYFTPDLKCVKTKNCTKSENGICTKCDEGYHLTENNKCTIIDHCLYPSNNGCDKCENNYFYDDFRRKCYLQINQYKNCKIGDYVNEVCKECDKGYYLYEPNRLCYDNSKEGFLYKCLKTDENGTLCDTCEDDYFLGLEDLKCSKIQGCLISENENKCKKCDEYYCLDLKNGSCFYNDYAPENENEKKYYACNITNDEGTECALCKNEFYEIKNGICVNNVECEKKENDKCVRCNEKSHDGYNMCLNNVFGCVETFVENCLRCDNILNFDECTECKTGYELNDRGNCVEL